jgi:hypothetical protein
MLQAATCFDDNFSRKVFPPAPDTLVLREVGSKESHPIRIADDLALQHIYLYKIL